MTKSDGHPELRKLPSGIDGFDRVSLGGFPLGRTTLVAGTAGSGKSILASQFLAEGIKRYEEPGVFVTFEETPPDLRLNVASLGQDIPTWEADNKWAFVDVSPDATETVEVIGGFDFGGLIARIDHAVSKMGARRVALDSLGSVLPASITPPPFALSCCAWQSR